MCSRSSCLPLAAEGRRLGCRALLSRCPLPTRPRPSAANISRRTVGCAEGCRPDTACGAFWTRGQNSSTDHEGPQLFSGLFGRKEAAVREEQQDSTDDTDARLGELARLTFAHFALYFCSVFFIDSVLLIPFWLVWGYLTRTLIWSPTAVPRTAVALKAPLPLVRLLTIVRALDLNAITGDSSPHTALTMACKTGNTKRIPGLLSLGARPDVAPAGEPRPLLIASHLGNTEAVEELLRAGANPNFLPGDCTSPLGAACCGGHAGVVLALANAGAQVNAPVAPTKANKTRNYTPLLVAITFGHVEVVKALLQAGASPTATHGNGPLPIAAACAADDIPGPARAAIVHLLLQAGADPRVICGPQPGESPGVRGSRGGRVARRPSAIDVVARFGAAEVIPVLVAAGEDPGRAPADVSYEELQAGAPVPPLFTAVIAGHVGVVQALVAAGADVDATVGGSGAKGRLSQGLEGSYCRSGGGGVSGAGDRWGERGGDGGITALCVAAQLGHVDVVRVLAAAGANTRVMYADGTTPLKAARDGGMVEVEEVLLAAEAEWN